MCVGGGGGGRKNNHTTAAMHSHRSSPHNNECSAGFIVSRTAKLHPNNISHVLKIK